ncbi:hypothetical protein V8F20_007686 [Naviculisporaceae sp. PSN 640]
MQEGSHCHWFRACCPLVGWLFVGVGPAPFVTTLLKYPLQQKRHFLCRYSVQRQQRRHCWPLDNRILVQSGNRHAPEGGIRPGRDPMESDRI